MTKLSASMLAAFAMACGGGGKKTTDTPAPAETTPAPTEPSTGTDSATPASTAKQGTTATPGEPRKVMKLMLPAALEWKPLSPEAGDKGPQVATLWGDMQSEANGFFIKLPAGEKGMLHTHTNDYHALAIAGPSGAGQDGGKVATVPQGTYWMQPGGVAHINTCGKGGECVGFVHYTTGKFDFAPAKPVKGAKADPRYVEKKLKDVKWTPFDEKDPKGGAWSLVWGEQSAPNGMYIKLPAGNAPFWHIHKHDYHGVVLAGTLQHHESGTQPTDMPVGSYWWQPGGNKHVDLCKAGGPDCIVYTYFTGAFDVKPAE